MKTCFFIPVYNQIDEFPIVLEELREKPLECDTILIVNNGSDDGSEKLVRESGYPFIDLQKNEGVGYSNAIAIEWAVENGYDIFGAMAGNGKMLPAEMHRLINPIINGEADYVTGSRFLPGGKSPNLPLFRKLSIPMVNIFLFMLTGKVLTDFSCGYRCFKLDIVRQAQFDLKEPWLHTYGMEYYLYAKVIYSRRFHFTEVPITMRYPPKGKPYSKISGVKDWWAMLKPWLIARFDGKNFN